MVQGFLLVRWRRSFSGLRQLSSNSIVGLCRPTQQCLQLLHNWLQPGFLCSMSEVPSNTVYAEWSCVLWWQSIYTWEEGNWNWDRSNIAANEALPPGKLGKSWWTAEEIFMVFPSDVKEKQTKRCNQLHTDTELFQAHLYKGLWGLLWYSCMFLNIYLACTSHVLKNKKVMWQLPLTNYTFHPFNAGLHNQSHANINFLFNKIKGSVFLINRNIRYEQFPPVYTYQISLIAKEKKVNSKLSTFPS